MRLLLIEDDQDLCRALRPVLEAESFSLDECHDGEEGLSLIRENFYAAVLLDRMLPGIDGLTLLRRARDAGVATPVLMLTALGRIGDRVDGLDAGADDYLSKPFDTRELLARLRALTRRPATAPASAAVYGDFSLNIAELTLTGPKGNVTLSRKECELLEVLCKNAGTLMNRSRLLGCVWGASEIVEEANLDTYIHFVRRRLAAVGSSAHIATVRGAGYRLEVAPC